MRGSYCDDPLPFLFVLMMNFYLIWFDILLLYSPPLKSTKQLGPRHVKSPYYLGVIVLKKHYVGPPLK